MAEKPKSDFKKKDSGGGGGGGPVQGPVAFLFFVGLIGGAIYFTVTQGTALLPKNLSGGDIKQSTSTASNLLWRLFPALAPKIPGVPAGYTQNDMSVYARSVRVAAVTTSTNVVRVIVQGTAPGLTNVSGWFIRTKKGSQLVGAEGNNYSGLLQIAMLPQTADLTHDRLLLFDGTGKVVSEYVY